MCVRACAGLLDEGELTQALTLLNVINVKEVARPLSYNRTSLVRSHLWKGLVQTFVNVCGNGQGEITYDSFVKLLWQVTKRRKA